MRLLACLRVLPLLVILPVAAQGTDSDRDGLGDSTEAALLRQFAPVFLVSRHDCSVLPAQFLPGGATPTAVKDDGTIYGQATPRKGRPGLVELHFYHLWRSDCGEMGHALDAEHVSALVRPGTEPGEGWQAIYWYAAAHEDTLCDASQITRAAALDAVLHGPRIWISAGKHASFLQEQFCRTGCGGDRCDASEPIDSREVINLGEASAPAPGAAWIASTRWPLLRKMTRSDFPESRTARLDSMPRDNVAWATPSRRPAQAAVLGGNSAVAGFATGANAGGNAIGVSGRQTGSALGKAADKTGGALGSSAHGVKGALGSAARHTGRALGIVDGTGKGKNDDDREKDVAK